MNKTPICWVKNPDGTQGYTWNPITGCLNHVKGMCKGGGFPCYAYKLANGRLKARYLGNPNLAGYDADKLTGSQKIEMLEDPFYPRFWEDKLCLWGGKPKGIFACDMSDLFGVGIPELWTKRVLLYCKVNRKHRFYLLTKQPQNLIKFSPFPDNCWVGVTVANQKALDEAAKYLPYIQAKMIYLSIEPYLEAIDLTGYGILSGCNACCNGDRCDNSRHYFRPQCPICHGTAKGSNVKWVIIGSQTKPYKPPKIERVQEIVQACDSAGVKVFLKENLRPMLKDLPVSCSRWSGWGEGTHRALRQEFLV